MNFFKMFFVLIYTFLLLPCLVFADSNNETDDTDNQLTASCFMGIEIVLTTNLTNLGEMELSPATAVHLDTKVVRFILKEPFELTLPEDPAEFTNEGADSYEVGLTDFILDPRYYTQVSEEYIVSPEEMDEFLSRLTLKDFQVTTLFYPFGIVSHLDLSTSSLIFSDSGSFTLVSSSEPEGAPIANATTRFAMSTPKRVDASTPQMESVTLYTACQSTVIQ